MVFGPIPNREYHEGFMRKAIEMAELALSSDETPVGCVFVHNGKIIGRGINGTNASLNGTRHAEFVALAEIMAKHPPSILRETDLYVTVEPCIMCASALRQYRIRAVYFGCLNDRSGGCGGVMTVHSDPGLDPAYPVYGGLFREEAIMLLRKFYVQENNKAPDPKPKKNRELKTEILPVSTPQVNTPSVGTPTGEMANLALGKGGKEKRPKSPAKAG
ncbi:cytidine deaminase-like protein [Hortaea werneckii]|nr:cytidine deaminase-like protein [Hortaea werneckii]KAI7451497.1 cytidine deaminase-like protein [Hortaea werneckii]